MPARSRAHRNPYDREHQRLRASLIPAAIGTPCPGALVDGQPWRSDNCDQILTDPHRMHLDHTTPLVQGGTHGDRICCQPCNTGAGAMLGNHRRTRPDFQQSRQWIL